MISRGDNLAPAQRDARGYSVIIATYNYGRFLTKAIESALAQTVPAREIIVVDDGSTDDTQEVLAQFDDRVRVIRQSNQGQAAAWNAAFGVAEGEWIAFLDADDWWRPDRMQRCLAAPSDDAGVIMHDLTVVGPGGELGSWVAWTAVRIRDGVTGEHTVSNGLPWSFTPTSGLLARRSVLSSIFPLDPRRWRTCADAPVLHRAAIRTAFHFIDEELGFYRVHGDNAYHQQGWYDGDDRPRVILENLWLTQRLAYEVNLDLERAGRRDRVALWNNAYYSKMIGWVAGRHSWWDVVETAWRQNGSPLLRPRRLRAFASAARELHGYQMRRDRAIGPELRRLAAAEFPGLDLTRPWAPDVTRSD